MPPVTAILLKYQRPYEIDTIIKYLRQFDFIEEILIHDNSGDYNDMSLGRYIETPHALNDIIYVQDDDCIIKNLQQLYDEFNALNGECLVNGMKAERMPFYLGKDSMVGWGTFFKKEWVSCLEEYADMYGVDYLLKREADRIFTYLTPVLRHTFIAEVLDFPSAMHHSSLSLQSNHEDYKRMALERCQFLIKQRELIHGKN